VRYDSVNTGRTSDLRAQHELACAADRAERGGGATTAVEQMIRVRLGFPGSQDREQFFENSSAWIAARLFGS